VHDLPEEFAGAEVRALEGPATAISEPIVFVDDAVSGDATDDLVIPRTRRGLRRPRRSTARVGGHGHRGILAAACVVVLAGAGVGAALSTSSSNGGHRALGTSTEHSKTTKPTTTTTLPGPPTISPISATSTVVDVSAPSGPYSLTFDADGPCWLGFQQQRSPNGPWLATPTLGTGTTDSFKFSANGPLVVVIGAPNELTSVELNGVQVDLPAGRVNPYDLTFVPATTST
jgi:hypothetical protein